MYKSKRGQQSYLFLSPPWLQPCSCMCAAGFIQADCLPFPLSAALTLPAAMQCEQFTIRDIDITMTSLDSSMVCSLPRTVQWVRSSALCLWGRYFLQWGGKLQNTNTAVSENMILQYDDSVYYISNCRFRWEIALRCLMYVKLCLTNIDL